MSNINEKQLEAALRRDEDEVLHAYFDSKGFITIGIGVLIDERKGGGITKEESSYLFNNRLKSKVAELKDRLPWADKLSDARMGVLVNMAYQMGVSGLLGFRNALAALKAGDYERCANEMLDSKWAKVDSPNRAKRLAKQMREDKWV